MSKTKILLHIDQEQLNQVRKLASQQDRSTNAQIRVLIHKGIETTKNETK